MLDAPFQIIKERSDQIIEFDQKQIETTTNDSYMNHVQIATIFYDMTVKFETHKMGDDMKILTDIRSLVEKIMLKKSAVHAIVIRYPVKVYEDPSIINNTSNKYTDVKFPITMLSYVTVSKYGTIIEKVAYDSYKRELGIKDEYLSDEEFTYISLVFGPELIPNSKYGLMN